LLESPLVSCHISAIQAFGRGSSAALSVALTHVTIPM
jgi:hypothetical protein